MKMMMMMMMIRTMISATRDGGGPSAHILYHRAVWTMTSAGQVRRAAFSGLEFVCVCYVSLGL